ncbi:ABC transporter permease [Candidatus Neptunochlamydia vexilliferae]|nr:FtsX-like permease family protein [Candidatus Neptunochlamydia vexilliferae]
MSLIALMSVGVISLVVWLVLVFLSVTDGIEKNWLKKLTSLNAPIRITPTEEYYHSYYYQIDSISSGSDYTLKSIGEKQSALLTDPYAPEEDQAIPKRWPEKMVHKDGTPKDLVKEAFGVLGEMGLKAQDYEVSGAVLKLRMVRPQGIAFSRDQEKGQGFLTQVSYISTFNGQSPQLPSLLEPTRMEDLNHLFFLADVSAQGISEDTPEAIQKVSVREFQERVKSLLTHIEVQKLEMTSHRLQPLASLLSEGEEFDVYAPIKHGAVSQLVFPTEKKPCTGKVKKSQGRLHYVGRDGSSHIVSLSVPIFVEGKVAMEAALCPYEIEKLKGLNDLRFAVEMPLQGKTLKGQIPWDGVKIAAAEVKNHFETKPEISPPWPYFVGEEAFLPETEAPAVVLPKHFQNSQVEVGDIGYFSYGAATSSSVQEQRLPVTVAGFYDPGVMAIGAKVILSSSDLPHAINAATDGTIDPNMINGIQVYLSDLDKAKETKAALEAAFVEKGLSPYWKITTFHEYDFAKDLLQQFQSDKYLFTLIGAIVLIVACSNIISLLIILVNDKKKEIAILSAMGASKKSIALIFTLCGGIMGTLSTLIGTVAAMLTLHNIDGVVSFLSFLQGHDAFNAVFYGKSLPNELSNHALTFILIATPIISLLAGLVPALKATKLAPSQILRSE